MTMTMTANDLSPRDLREMIAMTCMDRLKHGLVTFITRWDSGTYQETLDPNVRYIREMCPDNYFRFP